VDTIYVGAGTKHVIGGYGKDTITAGAGNHVIIGDAGQIDYDTDGSVKIVATTDTEANSGYGDADTITITGDGSNHLLGGMGADTISSLATTAPTTDIILGDNGTVTYAGATGSLKLSQIVSTVTSRGGNDAITTGAGTKHIVGGFGSDAITATAGNHNVIGDAGQIDYDTDGARKILATTDTEANSAFGDNDTITITGDGSNHLLGGMGADTISSLATTAGTTDTILGDNGTVTYAGATGSLKLSQIVSTVTSRGGNDVITTGAGTKYIIGGYGKDTITAGIGNHVIIGDAGQIDFDTDGSVKIVATTDTEANPGYGDTDTIATGNGNTIVMGGMGADTITTATGTDVILGDNGTVTYAGVVRSLKLSQITSTLPSLGGNDTITTRDGDKHVIAGYGSDNVSTGNGNDIVLGDNGIIEYEAGIPGLVYSMDPSIGGEDVITTNAGSDIVIAGAGFDNVFTGDGKDAVIGDLGKVTLLNGGWQWIETTDVGIGTDDFVDGGAGEDIMFGGAGKNMFVGSLTEDIMVGTYGRSTIVNGAITSLIRLDSIDIVSNTTTSVIERNTNSNDESYEGDDSSESGFTQSGNSESGTGSNAGNGTGTGTGTGNNVGGGNGFGNFFSPQSAGGWIASGSVGLQMSEFGGFFRSDEFSMSDSLDNSYLAESWEVLKELFAGLMPQAPWLGPAVADGRISVPATPDRSDAADQESDNGDASMPQDTDNGQAGPQQPAARQESAQSGGQQSAALTAENNEDRAKVEAGLGLAVAGMTGWKVLSGKDLDRNRVIELDSFRKLAEKQENRRFKKWKNAGVGR
jgi:Ca2+-binding RTX toxin-like protein